MGWQERRYDDSGSGDGPLRRALRRVFVEGDDFYSWSVPIFTAWGIRVRIHIFYLIFIAAQLIWPIRRDTLGFAFTAFSMACLFVLVLLHEFGHCFACRRVGGEADRILMWPLGGLASCRPPHRWQAALVTTLGGPGVNLALIPVFGGILLALGAGWEAVVFNPFAPTEVWSLPWFSFSAGYWKYFLWSAHYMNMLLFAFNMVLVMYPMDAGKIVQELLWWRLGYKKSMTISVNMGLVVAVLLGVLALTWNQSILFGIALFGGITCFIERNRLRFLEEDGPLTEYDFARGFKGMPGGDAGGGPVGRIGPRSAREQERAYKEAQRRQQVQQRDKAEVDRIFQKITDSGIHSLTKRERAALEKETERKRKGN